MSEIREEVRETEIRQETDTRQEREPYESYENFGKEEILDLLHKGQYTRLRQVIQELNDADIADYIEDMGEEEIVKIFNGTYKL